VTRYDFAGSLVKKSDTSSGKNLRGRLRRIEGRHNALVKDLRRAFAKGALDSDGSCAIEGLRIVEEAIRSGLKFRAIFFAESAANVAERILPQIGAQVETVELEDSIFASAVPTETPQGIAALVAMKAHSLEDVLRRSSVGPVVIVAGVQDPGNLGTIMRSAEAFGAGGVLLGEGTVSQFNSKVVRASAGSVFRLPIARTKLEASLDGMRKHGLHLVATSSHKGTTLSEADLSGALALFIGNEGAGLARDLLGKMDELIAIPHSAQVESLNAGVAASIILYEAARQRAGTQGEAVVEIPQ
jgi:RNA methyltransferase, TrmH family